MNTPTTIFLILLLITIAISLIIIIIKKKNYGVDNEHNPPKEDILNSSESYVDYHITIKSETAHDLHFLINSIRSIMLASILINILVVPTLLYKAYISGALDSDIINFFSMINVDFGYVLHIIVAYLLGIIALFVVIGLITLGLLYVRTEKNLRAMRITFSIAVLLIISVSIIFMLN